MSLGTYERQGMEHKYGVGILIVCNITATRGVAWPRVTLRGGQERPGGGDGDVRDPIRRMLVRGRTTHGLARGDDRDGEG